jgi:hypothetical protein
VREPLRTAGLTPLILRVDFEPALEAVLSRGKIDIVIYDPATPGLPRSVLDAKLQEHGLSIPIVVLGDPGALASAVQNALVPLRN